MVSLKIRLCRSDLAKRVRRRDCFMEMADLQGESSNHLDDLFKDLEDWEEILSSLPDFGVDQNQDEMELPALAIH